VVGENKSDNFRTSEHFYEHFFNMFQKVEITLKALQRAGLKGGPSAVLIPPSPMTLPVYWGTVTACIVAKDRKTFINTNIIQHCDT
jgi:hypothetical protein